MLKRALARLLDATGALEPALGWLHPRWLPILAYHRIHPDAESELWDRGVIDATPDDFEWQMATLARYFTPILASELAQYLRTGTPLPHNPALVTFDDGYRACATYALPILRAHGVRATFFISTSHVAERRVFWWDRISHLVRTSRMTTLRLRYPDALSVELGGDREPAVRQVSRVVKKAYDLDVERFLSELAIAAEVSWDPAFERGLADELLMTWDDVRSLASAGMEIGSHTRTHRVLQNIRPEELESELFGSKEDLERELGERVRSISYPVGGPISSSSEIVDAVERAGYEIGFSTGISRHPPRFHRFDIGRTMLDRDLGRAGFRALLTHPFFAAA